MLKCTGHMLQQPHGKVCYMQGRIQDLGKGDPGKCLSSLFMNCGGPLEWGGGAVLTPRTLSRFAPLSVYTGLVYVAFQFIFPIAHI